MTLKNVLITSCSMQALNGLFSSASSDQLPPQLCAKLINALYDYQPPPTDSQPIQAWITLMQQAHVNLAKSDSRLCLLNLPRIYKTFSDFYLSNRMDTSATVTLALQPVTSECLQNVGAPQSNPQVLEVIDIHHSLLSYQYFKSLNLVLHLITALFKALGEQYNTQLIPIVKTLAELRESNQTLFPYEVDNAVGAAIRSLGPEIIINSLPLLINDPSQEFKRSWILPLLKENVKGSTLKCFIDSFLPLTTACKNEADKYKAMNDQIKALSYDLLQSQIWALLPSFANNPTDISATFPSMAKALGGVLNARADLRLVVLSCLRQLVTFSVENSRQEDQATLARYAKNFLPILFNIYTTKVGRSDEEGVRLASLETIKVYLKLAQAELCNDLFHRAAAKAQSEETETFMKECSMDLLRALTRYQSIENLQALYNMIMPNISLGPLQKKYYKLLEEILSGESEAQQLFLDQHLPEIQSAILSAFPSAKSSSKGARLKCIEHLLNKHQDKVLVEAVLPEAVITLKDLNSKTRETAHRILAKLFAERPLEEFYHPILAGLTATPALISCSILALASMVYHCKDKMTPEIEESVLRNVALCALENSRDIVSSAMSFIKVYVTSQGSEKVGRHVPHIIRIFSAMHEDCKKHNRNRTRDMLARFIRWYGADVILPLVPQEDEVLLARVKNLTKIHGRKQRKRASERASEASGKTGLTTFSVANHHKTIEEILAESDEDIDGIEEEDNSNKRKAKKNQTWITEGGDDIVDFMDNRVAARNISGSKPIINRDTDTASSSKSKNSQFKSAPDGRLIIMDDDGTDDDEPGKRKKKSSILPGVDIPGEDTDSDFSDDGEDWMTTAGESVAMNKKRARSTSSACSAPPSKYQAGGKGIHRPLSTTSSRKSGKKSAKNPYSQTGDEYKSKKGRGDVKRKGKPDPFAYLPLRRDALNKRKKMKAIGNLKNILNAAKKGVTIGTKRKMKNAKSR